MVIIMPKHYFISVDVVESLYKVKFMSITNAMECKDNGLNKIINNPWVVCFIASMFFFFEFVQLSSFDTLNHAIQSRFHLNAAQVGMLGSTFLWGNVLFLIPAGLILDKFGPRLSILFSLLLSIVGLILFSFSLSLEWAALGRLLSGIGNAFAFISMVVLVSAWFEAKQQGFAMGMLVNMAFIGGMFAHTPLVYLLKSLGWQNLMLANAGFGILVWALIYVGVQDRPLGVELLSKNQKSNQSLVDVLKHILNYQNFSAGFYTSCLNLPILVLCALWGTQYLQVAHHLTMIQASNVVSMIFFGSMIGGPLLGGLSDKLKNRKKVMMFGGVFSLIFALPMVLTTAVLSPFTLAIIFFSLGFFSAAQVISYPVIAESNAHIYAGRACSFASLIIMGGGMLAQVLFSSWVQSAAHGQIVDANAFRSAMNLFPISIGLAIVVLWFMQETYGQQVVEK